MRPAALLLLSVYLAFTVPDLKRPAAGLTLHWEKNILTLRSPRMPGEKLEIWYLEAFCKRGSTRRDWRQTTIPHQTRLLRADPDGRALELESLVDGRVRVRHQIRAVPDGADLRLTLTNLTDEPVDIEWAQPCVRVDRFTGLGQQDYVRQCFLFTATGFTMLDHTRRTEEALYRGGQVYVPKGISLEDVNPRPISPDVPVNRLMGCFSADGTSLLATAWDPTQELFQGVIVCIHNDFRIGGLAPRQAKQVHGKLYLLPSHIPGLLKRYREDFGGESLTARPAQAGKR